MTATIDQNPIKQQIHNSSCQETRRQRVHDDVHALGNQRHHGFPIPLDHQQSSQDERMRNGDHFVSRQRLGQIRAENPGVLQRECERVVLLIVHGVVLFFPLPCREIDMDSIS